MQARAVLSLVALVVAGCSTGDPAVAHRNPVFYAWDSAGARGRAEHERPYPPLDLKQSSGTTYSGVEVLQGDVRLSRPDNWVIRAASSAPGGRYIQYVSPNEYIFGVYVRNESPEALWPEVLARYEKDLADSKAQIVHGAVPMATWNAQGRAYLVSRKVPAAREPFVNLSREYLARAQRRVVLVQVVHPTSGLEPLSRELSRVLDTLQVQ